MSLSRIKIENYKSIKYCDILINNLNLLIGGNGSGKTNILEAINYFYRNLTSYDLCEEIYDINNKYSNYIKITLYYDLSEFVKISKSNTESFEDSEGTNVKYGGYYKSIVALAHAYTDNVVTVEMTQIKGKGIKWSHSYKERFLLKSLFPLFYIDTRNLDITEWKYVWDTIAELCKISNFERESIEEKINELISSNTEITKKFDSINDIFKSSTVDVKYATSKEFAQNMAKIFLSGETIYQNGKQLGYYSTGTNSVKYIELLLKAISEIARMKMKEPIVLFDEPEISLHPSYIDELSDAIVNAYIKLNIIISTHSSRLIKSTLTQYEDVFLFNVKLIKKYTQVRQMKKFIQYSPTSKYRVTDDHVNSYFSNSILFVEGETELELFSNPYLRMLYPKLKKVDIYKAMSQTPILNIMHPNKAHTNIPYICLIDMDKAIFYDTVKKMFVLKNEYFPENKKEYFMFKSKKDSKTHICFQHNRIKMMADKLRIHYFKPYYSCKDLNYFDFIQAVREYLLNYNIFAFRTTVEGSLINKYSYRYAINYLKKINNPDDFEDFNQYFDSLKDTDKINVLRIVFNGKSDLLQKYNKTIKPIISEDLRLKLEKVMVGKKTSGWISEYLDYFFSNIMDEKGKLSLKGFKKYLENTDNRLKVLREFENNFPELYSIINMIVI